MDNYIVILPLYRINLIMFIQVNFACSEQRSLREQRNQVHIPAARHDGTPAPGGRHATVSVAHRGSTGTANRPGSSGLHPERRGERDLRW